MGEPEKVPVRGYTLPAGFYLPPQRPCPACGRWMVRVDDVEGLPVYQCPKECGAKGGVP